MILALVTPGALVEGREVRLAEGEVHHFRVRRVREGDPVGLRDGKGGLGEGRVVGDAHEGCVVVERAHVEPPPPVLGLAVGAGDKDRFQWLVEKAAELGVTDVIPLETERTAGVGNRVRGEHVEKLQRRALEAIKQSGASWAPVVHMPHTLPELVARHRTGARWLADATGHHPPGIGPGAGVWAAIGPEGGFAEAEKRLLLDAGWVPVRLGDHVLRFETAGLVVAAHAHAARAAGGPTDQPTTRSTD